jgi:hypothetical protein
VRAPSGRPEIASSRSPRGWGEGQRLGPVVEQLRRTAAPPGAKPVAGKVDGNPPQPGAEPVIRLQRGEALPGPEERLLRQVLGLGLGARQAPAGGVDPARMQSIDPFEGGSVPGPRPRQQALFLPFVPPHGKRANGPPLPQGTGMTCHGYYDG